MVDKIVMNDIRKTFKCRRETGSARLFFMRHNLNWKNFLKEGVAVEEVEATGDAMALKVIEVARGRK